MKGLFFTIFTFSLFSVDFLFAAIDASYYHSSPVEEDPGNEVIENDVLFKFTLPVYQSEDKKSVYSVGTEIKSTNLKFESPILGDLNLLKVLVPISGTHIGSSRIINWTLSPGMFGPRHNFTSESEFRLQGQIMAIIPSGKTQWILGAGSGDTFGEVKYFPLLGAIYKASDSSTYTVMFPLLKYEYLNSQKTKYIISIEPAGNQWQWKPGEPFDTDKTLDVTISGIKYSLGLEKPMSKYIVYSNIGVIADRKFEIHRHDDASISGEQDLENNWFFQLGLKF